MCCLDQGRTCSTNIFAQNKNYSLLSFSLYLVIVFNSVAFYIFIHVIKSQEVMIFSDPTLFHSTFLTFFKHICSILGPIQPKNGWGSLTVEIKLSILLLHLWTTQLQQGRYLQVELFKSNELNCINSCVTCCFCSIMSSCFEFFKRFTIVKLLTRICCILSFCASFLH